MRLTFIGERLNSSRTAVARALADKNTEFVRREAQLQLNAGAQYIDINAGALAEREAELLLWMAGVVRGGTKARLSLDTTNPDAALACLRLCPDGILLNGLTGDKSRFEAFLPLAKSYGCEVIALCANELGLPNDPESVVDIAGEIVERWRSAGGEPDRIYLDPAVRPISMDTGAGIRTIKAIASIRQRFPGVHIVIGLSNVSFGLPARGIINQTFAVLALSQGVDSFILDPCDRELMATLLSAQTVLNHDEHCRGFISAYREGRLS